MQHTPSSRLAISGPVQHFFAPRMHGGLPSSSARRSCSGGRWQVPWWQLTLHSNLRTQRRAKCGPGCRSPRRVGQATWRRCWMGLARAPPARDPKVGRSSEAGRAMMWQGNVHTLWSSRARLPQALGGERTNMLRSSVSSEPGNGVCVHASVMAGWMEWTDDIPDVGEQV